MALHKFGRFAFDAATGALAVDGLAIDLGSRAGRLLRLLIERRGSVVTKQQLIEAAWGHAAIEGSNLSVQIARLRRLTGGSPEWIETIGRIGYRFLPEAVAVASRHSLAVTLAMLPPAGLDDRGAELAPGLGDDLTIALARFRSLSLMTVDGDAAYLLRATIRGDGGTVRVGAHLIERANGRILWSERFDKASAGKRVSTDRLVDTLAARIESRIQRAEFDAAGAHECESVPDLYRRARCHLTIAHSNDNAAAMALLDRALEREPDNVALMAAACEARATRISMGWPMSADDWRRCAELARDGLRLSADDAHAHAAFGFGLFRTGDKDFGLAVMQRAVEMNPNCLPALIYAATASMHWGRVAAAEEQYRRALRLAPNDPSQTHVMGGLSRIRMMQGRFEEALRWSERALLVNQNYGGAHWSRVAASAQLGRMNEARRHLAAFQRAQPGVTIASIRAAQPTRANRMAATLEGLERAGLALAG